MIKIDNITIEEIISVFEKSSNKKEVLEYFGYKQNVSGQHFIKKLIKKANINCYNYFKKNDRYHYNLSPKKCLACGVELPYEKRFNKFCSCNCAATYNNIKRGKHSIETRVKISETLKGNELTEKDLAQKVLEFKEKNSKTFICKQCGKETKKENFCCVKCKKEYEENEKISKWLKGENFVKGATQVPNFIKRYLMAEHGNKCEKCGWAESNKTTGKIPLEIHHIDGDCTNNKRENLQLLCPNCHSLTPNFGSLNKGSKRFHRKKNTLKDIN